MNFRPLSCIQRPLIFLRVFPHPWRNDSSLSDAVKAKSDAGCGRITENSPSKLNFPRKCRLKEQVTRFSETSCSWRWKKGGRSSKKRIERIFAAPRIKWTYLFALSSEAYGYHIRSNIGDFTLRACLSRLMIDDRKWRFCLHRIFVANLFFTWQFHDPD